MMNVANNYLTTWGGSHNVLHFMTEKKHTFGHVYKITFQTHYYVSYKANIN